MNRNKIYLSSPHMGGSEINYIREAYETNWVAPLGPNVDAFEKDLVAYSQSKYCAALSSGTAAIHLALIMLDVKHNDEVLCSSFTFSASANPILYQLATPVFVDSEGDTYNMSPSLLETAINARIKKGKKPKACIIVHLYGMPAKMAELSAICNHYDIPIIEDSAEALGSSYKGQKLGTFGALGIYSFNGNKIITTSGGGALISDTEKYITKAKFLATQARDPAPHYQHTEVGYNYRMSNICAGIGRGQMEVLVNRIEQRRVIHTWYKEILAPYDFISFQKEPTKDFFSNRWLTTIIINDRKKKITRETIRLHLLKANIESRPLWKPMHLQPIFKEYPSFTNGVSDHLFTKGLCLPSGSNMTNADKERIKNSLISVLNK